MCSILTDPYDRVESSESIALGFHGRQGRQTRQPCQFDPVARVVGLPVRGDGTATSRR